MANPQTWYSLQTFFLIFGFRNSRYPHYSKWLIVVRFRVLLNEYGYLSRRGLHSSISFFLRIKGYLYWAGISFIFAALQVPGINAFLLSSALELMYHQLL